MPKKPQPIPIAMPGGREANLNNRIDSDAPLPPTSRASAAYPSSPTYNSLPPLPSSPKLGNDKDRDTGRKFFANYKASQSSSRLQPAEPTTIRQVSETNLTQNADSREGREGRVYASQRRLGSSPDLLNFNQDSRNISSAGTVSEASGSRRNGSSLTTDEERLAAENPLHQTRKQKPRPFAHLLGRSRNARGDGGPSTPKTSLPFRNSEAETAPLSESYEDTYGLRTAPLGGQERDRSFRDMMSSSIRNRSADRQHTMDPESASIGSGRDGQRGTTSNSGGAFLAGLKTTSTKAADGLGKAGKGIFGKLTRSSSSGEREGVADENYVCKIITKPLVEQVRITRISKRLEDSKDKTEFWMPALPWRCIDYLNFKGCEEEGLYRIPGSGPRIREWQRRFDTELDIDLFDEPDLYDINIIGSMFKAWLRELPDEIFPKATQDKIAAKCLEAKETPQMLKDELSKLPPFNYYLLFAITCHLSLLHSYVDKNKMNYQNLCICFQPSMKIDAFCFKFLVCDWKNCWQGCWTEKEALVEEYRILDQMAVAKTHTSNLTLQLNASNERALSSAGSDLNSPGTPRSPTKRAHHEQRGEGRPDNRGVPERLNGSSGHNPSMPPPSTPQRPKQQSAPSLAPVLPLSPMNL